MNHMECTILVVKLNSKISSLGSSLCDHRDANILVKGTKSIPAQIGDNPNNRDEEVVFKNYALFIDCISKINNLQIDNAKNIDVVMLIII